MVKMKIYIIVNK